MIDLVRFASKSYSRIIYGRSNLAFFPPNTTAYTETCCRVRPKQEGTMCPDVYTLELNAMVSFHSRIDCISPVAMEEPLELRAPALDDLSRKKQDSQQDALSKRLLDY